MAPASRLAMSFKGGRAPWFDTVKPTIAPNAPRHASLRHSHVNLHLSRPLLSACSSTFATLPNDRTARSSRAVLRAIPDGRDAIFNGDRASSMAAAPVLPLPPPPPPALPAARSTTWPVEPLRPLLAAVVTVSAGRLASVPPPLLTWLLHVMTLLGYRPPTNWLAELYDSLLERLDDLKQAAAAQAFMAIATLATADTADTSSSTSSGSNAAVPPAADYKTPPPAAPTALLGRLYERLGRVDEHDDTLDSPLALATLQAAAAAAAASAASSVGTDAGGASSSPLSRTRCQQTHQHQQLLREGRSYGGTAAELHLAMPRAIVEALALRAVGLQNSMSGGTMMAPGEGGDMAALAAARVLVAAVHLAYPPGPDVVSPLLNLVIERCGGGAPNGGGSSSGGDHDKGELSPPLLVQALTAGYILHAPPLPSAAVSPFLRSLEPLLPQLDAVQLSYTAAALYGLVSPPTGGDGGGSGVTTFLVGPMASALTVKLAVAPAAALAPALTALPPPLRPLPSPLAAASHDALRNALPSAADGDITEALRQLDAVDALPPYGWQGALAAATNVRLADAAAADLMSSQELCSILFVLAALNYRPAFSWTADVAAALQSRLLTLTSSQLTNALWALAKFGHRAEPRWAASAVQAVQLQLPYGLEPNQLSYSLGSLQHMSCQINVAVLDEILSAAVAANDQLASYPPGDLVLLLMTVARLRYVPSYSFTEAVTERLRPYIEAAVLTAATAEAQGEPPSPPGLGSGTLDLRSTAPDATAAAAEGVTPLTCQELVSVGYALAKLHSRPEADWMSSYMSACQRRLPECPVPLLATLLWSVGELGQTPSPTWLAAFLAAARPQLPQFAGQDLVAVLSSLGALRSPPEAGWLGEALTVVGARVGGLDGAAVAALLKALVDLDARVSNPEWYDALCDQVSGFLPLLPPTQLVDLLSALGVLGHKPKPEWLQRACTAAVRVLAQTTPLPSSVPRPPSPSPSSGLLTAAGSGGGNTSGGGGGGYAGLQAGGAGGAAYGGAVVPLSDQQLEALIVGLAQLGTEPPRPLLQAFFTTSANGLSRQPPSRVTALVSALAGANVAPEPAWLDALAAAVRQKVMSYTFVQLDALTRALGVFQRLVPEHRPTRDLLSYLREFCLYG